LRETASYEPSCVKISSVVFPVEDGKKKREGMERKGKEGHKKVKSRTRYISAIRGEALRKRIFTKFCTSGDMLDVIICANFGVEKLRGLGNTRGYLVFFAVCSNSRNLTKCAIFFRTGPHPFSTCVVKIHIFH